VKIRALVWDRTEASGVQSRRGSIHNHTNTHQAVKDMNKLKNHAESLEKAEVIDERNDHWNGPVDTIFSG
jgi:hypothetical protein